MGFSTWLGVGLLAAVGCISSEGIKEPPFGDDAGVTAVATGGTGTVVTTSPLGGGLPTGGAPTPTASATGGASITQGGALPTGGMAATGGVTFVCEPGSCSVGQPCTAAADCTSPLTCVSSKCSTCGDGIQDGTEPGVDCGGGCSTRCAEGAACNNNGDCATFNCASGTCGPATNPLANLDTYPNCNCVSNNAGVATKCKDIVIPCLLTNTCNPTEACAQNNDGVCGVNTINIDAAPIQLAVDSYNCVLAAAPPAPGQ